MSAEQPKIDPEAATLRMMIISSFLVSSTMVLLALNVNIIRQSALAGQLDFTGWLIAASIPLMLLAILVMLFMSAVMLVTMYLVPMTLAEKLRVVGRARTFFGLSSILILTSFGSTFLVSFGLESPWSWSLGAMGYGSGLIWALLRGYYLAKVLRPKQAQRRDEPSHSDL